MIFALFAAGVFLYVTTYYFISSYATVSSAPDHPLDLPVEVLTSFWYLNFLIFSENKKMILEEIIK
jgi:CRISPR/Cas system CMR subunit Cmr4 (Cas7 group RAMP superfamily)